MAEYIWGRYPVLEALRSRRRVHRVMVAQGPRDPALTQVVDQARRVGVPVENSSRRHLDELSKNANHQGVMALVAPRQYAELDDILGRAQDQREDALVLVLDAIQDVQNLGSLIRTAEAVGAHGVVIPEHRAAGLTPAVDKTSAGAVEFLPIARVTNITRTLEDLKKQGIWCIGLDGSADITYDKANLTGPIALVVGNEGKGISRLVREHCDLLVNIPMRGHVGSLNAAIAGSVALYEIWRQRGWTTGASTPNDADVDSPEADALDTNYVEDADVEDTQDMFLSGETFDEDSDEE